MFRVEGFRVSGFRCLGSRVLGFRDWGLKAVKAPKLERSLLVTQLPRPSTSQV